MIRNLRYLTGLTGLLAWLLAATAATAQAPTDSEAELERAAVTIDGRDLLYVRGIVGRSAEQRAAAIAGRIVEAASDPELTPDELRAVETVHSTQILAGERLLMTVSDADAATERVDRQTMVRIYSELISDAVAKYRLERLPDRRLRALARVLAATAVLAVAIGLLLWATRRLSSVLEQRIKPRLESASANSLELIPRARAWSMLAAAVRGIRVVLVALSVYVYAQFALIQFPHTRSIGERLLAYLIDPLQTMGSTIVAELPSLLFLLVLFVVVRILLRALQLYFDALARGSTRLASFEPEWAAPTYRLTRVAVIALALVVAYPYIPGSDSEAFKGLSIFFGVLLSIGSSSFVANSIAGYALIYRRLFKVGDRVLIGETVGYVLEIRMQVTRLRTIKNEEVIIPNSTILGSVVLNYSSLARSRGLILHTTVGIGYETPWRQVEGMLLTAAERTPGLQSELPPFVLQRSLGDFCVSYELNAYTSSADNIAEKYNALHANILDVFNEYGVQIMTPAYEGDPAEPKIVPKERWFQEPSRPAPKEPPPAGR
jgi:small-conductance mechanosensitive channel